MITSKHGSLAPDQMKVLGVVFCISVILLPVGLFILFAEQGTQFQPENKLYRYYIGIWGMNFGKWNSYEAYTDMALLSKRMTSSSFSQSNRQNTQTELVYELHLLTPDHRTKLLAYVFKSKEAADKNNPADLAKELGVKYTSFNPRKSPQTTHRRR